MEPLLQLLLLVDLLLLVLVLLQRLVFCWWYCGAEKQLNVHVLTFCGCLQGTSLFGCFHLA